MTTSPARAFEPWMLSNVVSGAVTGSFMVLLIPPFITAVTGSAARVGVVFAVISLSALTGPFFGRMADRYRIHRLLYTSSYIGIALAFAIFAIDDAHQTYSSIAGILFGASMAAKMSVGSGMLVGSGLPEKIQTQQLTVFNLLVFGGQVIGGVLVALLGLVGLDTRAQFWIVSGILVFSAVLTGFGTRTPQRRMQAAASPAADGAVPAAPATPFFRTLRSPFGVLLLLVLLGGLCLSVVTSQIANIMPRVFHIDPTATSLLVAGAGLLGVPAVLLTGTWMGRSGPGPALVASVIARGIGLAGMASLGLVAGGPAVATLAAVLYLAVAVSSSLQRSPMPRVAALLSPAGASEANGLVGAAGALGAFFGCLGAGIIADLASFEGVLWLSGICGVLGVLLLPSVSRAIATARASASAS